MYALLGSIPECTAIDLVKKKNKPAGKAKEMQYKNVLIKYY